MVWAKHGLYCLVFILGKSSFVEIETENFNGLVWFVLAHQMDQFSTTQTIQNKN